MRVRADQFWRVGRAQMGATHFRDRDSFPDTAVAVWFSAMYDRVLY